MGASESREEARGDAKGLLRPLTRILAVVLVLVVAEAAWPQSRSLSDKQPARSKSLDEVPKADPRRLEQATGVQPVGPDEAGKPWQPAACGDLENIPIESPSAGSSPLLWRATFERARQKIASARKEVDQATSAFSAALNRGTKLPGTRARLGEKRDAARARYSRALCEYQALLEEARRAGVQPELLREAESALPDTRR